MNGLESIAEIKKPFGTADDVGVKTVSTEVDLKRFRVKIFFSRLGLFQPDPPVQSFAGRPEGASCRPARRTAANQTKDLQG
jgi:hypothetical protein